MHSGKLNKDSIGFSRQPVFRCNLSKSLFRKKKWNYWCVMSPDCLFSATISHLDYAGMVFTYFLDLNDKRFAEQSKTIPFGIGCTMPDTVHATVGYKSKNSALQFISEKDRTRLIVTYGNFKGLPLEADITVFYPQGHETLNVVVPWSDTKFQFTSKHECLPAQGTVRWGEDTYELKPEDSFACLDFGRGIWPYKVSWNWANASGIADGRHVGLNLGAKWTDNTGMTENGFVVDGRLTKLSEDVLFEYDKQDFMKPWHLRTAVTDRVDVWFTPFYERVARTDFGVIKSDVHQMIGHYSGTIKTDEGSSLRLEALPGCCEDHYGQW